ncbi:TPA: TetR/AcrR family transcriptional regulator [Pseudomonas aeruginosa]|nr:TetR/AcrR family transcriptional regulator [Pseudomonas aeruginosa]MBH9082726.1 TetR/AcrR family transcriptional regulator [Pseudomonas aeruginosa]HBN8605839.1 TetR/AcrR family transcriptional regulator [Pseudomonas aeruginosa]HCS8192849.1 TetR/AcrR family transcriptional regulator [Pseudomonas aeruginosa]HEP9053906.1 TetR/AcrR family transcriptional regulator [Pseudomonas aeruginosa]
MPSSTRASLMQTAESLLCTRGYAGFSYADLAEAVGIRKASIHHHFPAKEDLGVAVVEAYVERVARGLEGIEHECPTVDDRLAAFSQWFTQSMGRRQLPLCGALAAEMTVLPERLQTLTRQFFRLQLQWLQKVLDEGKAAGQLPQDADTAARARQVLGLLEGVSFIDWALNENPPSLASDVLYRIAGVVRSQAAAQRKHDVS